MGASEPKSGEWSEPAEIAWNARGGQPLVWLEVVAGLRGAREGPSKVEVGPWKLEGGVEAPRTE
jgi:hypothetical protein